MTYADVFRPDARVGRLFYDLLLVVGGSLLIALSAQIALPLPFSPVPITGQTFAVLLLAALFGRRLGVATVLAYLSEGVAGLPVFAGGGAGLQKLLGPTGGYLLGFVLAAWVVGRLAERGWDRSAGRTVMAMVAGNIAIYVLGLVWLGAMMCLQQAIVAGLLPFIPGDILKIVLAALVLPTGWKLISARPRRQDSEL
ncbi:MAG: biotin transporter BioY [Caldilineae bacterium]|nr:MAG: biotin transporter BioY [Caldilineae bacterium]